MQAHTLQAVWRTVEVERADGRAEEENYQGRGGDGTNDDQHCRGEFTEVNVQEVFVTGLEQAHNMFRAVREITVPWPQHTTHC